MKKLLTFLLAAIAFVACTQNDVDELSANRVDVPETLTVGFEGGDTRIELNEALKTVWTEGDEVSVFYYSDANNKFAYQGETGERFGELKLVGRGDSVADVPGVVTVYPYNPDYKINTLTANLLLNLPSKQYYKSDSYGENGNIMVAYSEFNQFMLRSVYGWLRIDITGEGQKVSTIRVKGNRGEQMAGAVHVDSNDATMTLANEQSDIKEDEDLGGVGGNIAVDGAAKDEVILDCKGEVELSSEATSFYVALPPQTLAEGFTVAIYCTNGTMMTKDCTNSVEIKRNHIHPVSAFKYNGMEDEEPDYPTSMTFALENIDTTSDYFSYTVDIIPSDKNTPYIVMSASPEYIEELGGTDDDIYADDYEYFEWVGSINSQSAVEIMQKRYKVGDAPSTTVNNATPGMPYIFYCYYVDYATGVRTSDIARFEITCGHPELTEVEFTMTTEVDGPSVFTDAVPVGFDGDYYTDVITAAEVADGEAAGYTKEEYIKLWWANIVVALKADYSLSDIIAMNTCKGQNDDGTPRSQYNFELMQNTDYYFFAFALEENALCASTPKLQAFRTGAVEP